MAKLQSVGSVAGKETIYVDVDDEITSIIDKVGAAKGKVVALVLPKRAPVLQSVVNMKLLKRTADDAGKNLVLVTTEAGLMPLAGAVGLHVASTPTSKPSIPSAPVAPGDEPEDIDEPLSIVDGNAGEGDEFDASAAADKSIGDLAAGTAAGKVADDDIDESIDMSDDAEPAEETAPAAVPKLKKDHKLKVPNFDSFRKKIVLGVLGVVVLVVAWIFAFSVLPSATITIHTDSSDITSNLNLTLDAGAKKLDTADSIVPATSQSQQKTSTQQVPATGQQNNGDKAAGSVKLTNCSTSNDEIVIPAGTTISASGHTYVINSSADLQFSGRHSNGSCDSVSGFTSASVSITALKGGADYNTGSTTFSVTGHSNVTATGSADGGTDDITKIVTQSDIDSATGKITSADTSTVKQQLISNLRSKGLQPVPTTFLAGTPAVTTSAKAGDTADNVTVTAVTTYTMFGVQKSDLQTLVDNNVNSQIDKSRQTILDDGVANAKFTEPSPATVTGASVSMETKSLAGPHIDVDALKTQLAGKKSGDVKNIMKQTPGVTDVDVKFSPFWVNKVPSKTAKVTIHIVKAD